MGEFRIAVSIFWYLLLFVHILTPECIRIDGQQSSGPMNLGTDGTGIEPGLEPLMDGTSSKPPILTQGRRQSKTSILSTNVDQKWLETEFSIAICRLSGDKWQSKTLFLAIFDPRSSIVKSVSNCRIPVVILVTSGNVGSAPLKEKLLKGKAEKFLEEITEESHNNTEVLLDAKTNDPVHLDHNATTGGSSTGEDPHADEKATVKIESHSVRYQTDRISSDESQVQNIDGHHVIVNPRKHVYTTLFFKSESRVLTIERTEHDEIRNCQFLTISIDAVFAGPTVIPTSEDTMDEMVEACRHIDDIRVSGRIKRSLNITVPGTKWCGFGNTAEDYDDLGTNTEIDKCCRKHDQCDGVPAFGTKSLCSCDEEYYNCLKEAGDTVFGTIYFDILSVGCVKQAYPEVCIRRGWLGRCIEYAIDTSKPKIWVFADNELTY